MTWSLHLGDRLQCLEGGCRGEGIGIVISLVQLFEMGYLLLLELMEQIAVLLFDDPYLLLLDLLKFLKFFDLDLRGSQLHVQLFDDSILLLQKFGVALPLKLELLLQLFDLFPQLQPLPQELLDLLFELACLLARHLRAHVIDFILLFGNCRDGAYFQHV